MTIKKTLITLSVATTLMLSSCGSDSKSEIKKEIFTQVKDLSDVQKKETIQTALNAYANMAISRYTQALNDAKALQTKVKEFTNAPSTTTLKSAKDAWLLSRESYLLTEAFRLSNTPIDAEEGFASTFGAPEGQLNAWPLDENMIDYVSDSNGKIAGANIINASGKFTPTGDEAKEVDVTTITKETLSQLNENGGDANIATGYHAIEFLLWGQDQDYDSFIADNISNGALQAGNRPLSDYTTDSHKDRRIAYINSATALMVDDLQSVVDAWSKGGYKEAFLGEGKNAISQTTALKNIFAGLGVFIKSELANERIAVAVLTPSEEDEHSCFSDNTHRDIVQDYQGFKDVLAIFSKNLSDEEKNSIALQEKSIDAKVKIINDVATSTYHFDYQIISANNHSQNIVDAKNEMRDLGDEIIKVAKEYGITLGEEDVTDTEETQI